MAKLVLLFVCVAIFQIATCLQCYSCDKDTCEKKMEDWQKVPCGKAADSKQTFVCTKQVYKDATSKKETTTRKCDLVDVGKTFDCKKTTELGELVSCDTCTAELCNSASKIGFSVTAASGILLALIVPKWLA